MHTGEGKKERRRERERERERERICGKHEQPDGDLRNKRILLSSFTSMFVFIIYWRSL